MFHNGQIIRFFNDADGMEYDGIVWRVLNEDETNVSLVVLYVDIVN